jgi:predicted RNA binding protein YcfA (HicA-like mRNA interferase family)
VSHIAPISYRKFVKFLEYVGCEESRQKGSHVSFVRDDLPRPVIVPKHKEIAVPVILSNLRTLKISSQKYLEIMRGL